MQSEPSNNKTVSDLLHELSQRDPHHPISVADIMQAMENRGFGMLLIIFCVIPALPIPAQGIATVLAIPTLFLAFQLVMGRKTPWMPQWIAKKTISGRTFILATEKITPYLKFFEKVSKPRFMYMTSSLGERIIGFFTIFFAISMALPIPFSNTIPSAGIVIMSLGLLERDGFAVKLGIILGSIGLFVTVALYTVGTQFLIDLWQKFIA